MHREDRGFITAKQGVQVQTISGQFQVFVARLRSRGWYVSVANVDLGARKARNTNHTKRVVRWHWNEPKAGVGYDSRVPRTQSLETPRIAVFFSHTT